MGDFAAIWILVWGGLGLLFTYFACLTQPGRDLMWSLSRFNPLQRQLFSDQTSHDAALKFFGVALIAFELFVVATVIYRLFAPIS